MLQNATIAHGHLPANIALLFNYLLPPASTVALAVAGVLALILAFVVDAFLFILRYRFVA